MSFYWKSSKYSFDRRETSGLPVFLSPWQYKAGGFPSECTWLKMRIRQQRWETERKCQWEQRCQSQISSASWWKPKINRSFQVSNSVQGAGFWLKTTRNKVWFQEVCKNTLSNATLSAFTLQVQLRIERTPLDAINHPGFCKSLVLCLAPCWIRWMKH